MNKKREIKDSHYHKFEGLAPEGFIMVPEEIFELLKDSNNWENFKNDPNWIEINSKKLLLIKKH